MQQGIRRRSTRSAVVVLGVLALVASSCGGGESSQEDDDDTRSDATTTTLEPRSGGRLIYGLEAETDGFDPVRSRWAPAGFVMGFAVMDPIAYFDEDGVARPYLAESIEPNDDYTVWTIKLREGVTFHDESTLDAADLIYLLESHKGSGLTQDSIRPIESFEAIDDLTVEITMSSPWVAFPAMLVSQVGALPPENYDEKWGPAANAPTGTGPFRFVEWRRGERFVAERNPDYWREGLPRLDQIEFRPVPDAQTRADAFVAGNLDVFHANDFEIRRRFTSIADAGDARLYESEAEGEELMLLFNTGEPPFDDVRMRRAVAHALDVEDYQALLGGGLDPIARGPFQESNPYYVETPGYPEFSPTEAQDLVKEYEDDGNSASFTVIATSSPSNLQVLNWLQDKLRQVNMDVTTDTLTQSELIITVITGDFQVSYWRQYAGPDPDMDYVWWHGDNAKAPREGLSLNMTRLDDDEVNDALDRGRQSPDSADRLQAYADLQHRWAELVPYVWLSRPQWFIVTKPQVHSILTGPLPDGTPALPLGGQFPSVHLLTHAWVEA